VAARRWTPIAIASLFVLACGSSGGGTDTSTDPGPAPDDTVAPDDTAVPEDALEDAPRDVPPGDVPAPTDVPADVAPDVPVLSAECAAVASNLTVPNTLTVDGKARSFLLTTPTGTTGPGGKWPVVFQFHGFVGASMGPPGDLGETQNFHKYLMGPAVNDPRMPFILVTPQADGEAFLDWNITPDDVSKPNPDVRLFDAVLACLDAKYGVDPDRVHLVGFSAGGILSDFLGWVRGDRVASILTWSGAYLVDEANAIESFPIYWPDMGPQSGYVQVMFHGGPTDQWAAGGMFTAHFDQWNKNDQPWLNGLHHDVILCSHTQGHTPPSTPPLTGYVMDFFAAHPRGVTTSPFATGIPASFPATCTYHAATP